MQGQFLFKNRQWFFYISVCLVQQITIGSVDQLLLCDTEKMKIVVTLGLKLLCCEFILIVNGFNLDESSEPFYRVKMKLDVTNEIYPAYLADNSFYPEMPGQDVLECRIGCMPVKYYFR